MTESSKYCPVCYADLSKIKLDKNLENKIGFKIFKVCPKCNVIINCDKNSSLTRCNHCLRLFGDIITYKEHLPCYLKKVVKCFCH